MFRVLHVLDHSLPLHSGYTFRTRAIMTRAGGATGSRCAGSPASATPPTGRRAEVADGLLFHRTPGLPRGPTA